MDLQSVEEEMHVKGRGNAMVQALLEQLDQAVVYSVGGNMQTNRKLWDNYSQEWSPQQAWVRKMSANVGMEDSLEVLGDEWAPRAHTNEIIETFILPHTNGGRVAEIGVGGGRIARAVVNGTHEFHAFDVSSRMLERTKGVLMASPRAKPGEGAVSSFQIDNEYQTLVTFTVVQSENQSLLGAERESFFDFIYSFDVLPHVDLHVIFKYLKEFYRTLKPGGKCFISTADLTSEGGWARFVAQKSASVGGFCFASPETILYLVEKAGFEVLQRGERRPDNVYLHRDLLLLLLKPE